MSDSQPRWYRVIIRRGQATVMDHLAGSFSRPNVALGSHCACCNVETPYAMEYALGGSTYSTAPLRIPRCYECRTHLPTSLPSADLQLFGTIVIVGFIVAAVKLSLVYAIPALLAAVGTAIIAIRKRVRRRAMQAGGHFIGLRVTVGPNTLNFRTTNPQFANEVARLSSSPSGERSAR